MEPEPLVQNFYMSMQFKLKLIKEKGRSTLPLNYHYAFFRIVSGLMEKCIALCSAAEHPGFLDRFSSSFIFGNFYFDSYEVNHQEELIVHRGYEATLDIRFLIDDEEEDVIKNILLGQP